MMDYLIQNLWLTWLLVGLVLSDFRDDERRFLHYVFCNRQFLCFTCFCIYG